MSGQKVHELLLDLATLQRHVPRLLLFTQQGPELHLDVSPPWGPAFKTIFVGFNS
jgi:hypothetical protein